MARSSGKRPLRGFKGHTGVGFFALPPTLYQACEEQEKMEKEYIEHLQAKKRCVNCEFWGENKHRCLLGATSCINSKSRSSFMTKEEVIE